MVGRPLRTLRCLGGARTFLGSALGLGLVDHDVLRAMGLSAAAAQLGSLAGAGIGGLGLARGGWASPSTTHQPTNKEVLMPFINVKVIEGVFDNSQRRQIVEKLTDAMVSIEGENMRGVTWCVVEEIKSGDWGIGGKGLTTADVKALAAGTD